MKLTTKGRFAVTAMLDLALHEKKSPVTIAQISKRQSISHSYLEQLFGRLRRQGLVKSIKGPGGGYQTALNYNSITIKKIITSVDEKIDSTQCGGRENCNEGGQCITHDLWASLNNKILTFLDEITLAELRKKEIKKIGSKVANSSSIQIGIFQK
jgi:Rrf2 family iron-sulfur cluster assembly transcriptional regulator